MSVERMLAILREEFDLGVYFEWIVKKKTYVDNVSLLLANDLKVPLPDFGGNGLTDRA